MLETIELRWNYVGPCPDQWFAYFYNKQEHKTYCVYIRQDSCLWSADIRNTDGFYDVEDFENLRESPSQVVQVVHGVVASRRSHYRVSVFLYYRNMSDILNLSLYKI